MDNSISRKKNIYRKNHSEQIFGMLFASIPVVGFLVFGVVPLIFSLFMSFSNVPTYDITEMTLFSGENLFQNYIEIFQDEKFWLSIKNTLLAAISLPISMIIALILAVILNQNIKAKRVFRTIFFIPYVCSIVALTLMWRTMLNKNYGFINEFLGLFGIPPIAWLTDPNFFMTGMIIMLVWCGIGFNLILYSAALTGISPSYYEAAEMDGANNFKKFFKVTLPLLSPTTFYLFVVGLISALQQFTMFQAINAVNSNLISPTGPNDTGLTIVFYLYNKAFGKAGGLGIAAAVGWVLTITILIITGINFLVKKRWVFSNEKE